MAMDQFPHFSEILFPWLVVTLGSCEKHKRLESARSVSGHMVKIQWDGRLIKMFLTIDFIPLFPFFSLLFKPRSVIGYGNTLAFLFSFYLWKKCRPLRNGKVSQSVWEKCEETDILLVFFPNSDTWENSSTKDQGKRGVEKHYFHWLWDPQPCKLIFSVMPKPKKDSKITVEEGACILLLEERER